MARDELTTLSPASVAFRRVEEAWMHASLRAIVGTAALAGAVGCATPPFASAPAQREYAWAMAHGCDCNPLAYAPKSAAPSLFPGQTVTGVARDRLKLCATRQFVVAAFGDGDGDLAADMNLARARVASFMRHLDGVTYRRIDALAFAGPHIAHPSTLAIICPTERLPARDSF